MSSLQNPPNLLTTERDTWLSQHTILYKTKTGEVQDFWLSQGYDFKIIVQIASDHLSVPTTSAASERVFSNRGNIITRRRSRLGGNNIRYLLCLRSWGMSEEANDDEFDSDIDEKEGGTTTILAGLRIL